LVNLAKVYTETRQLEKARIRLQQAMKLDPNEETARRMLNQLERQGKKQP